MDGRSRSSLVFGLRRDRLSRHNPKRKDPDFPQFPFFPFRASPVCPGVFPLSERGGMVRRRLIVALCMVMPTIGLAQAKASAIFAGSVVDSVQHPIANA